MQNFLTKKLKAELIWTKMSHTKHPNLMPIFTIMITKHLYISDVYTVYTWIHPIFDSLHIQI